MTDMKHPSRRAILSTCITAAAGGCISDSNSTPPTPTGQNVTVTDRHDRRDGNRILELSNSHLSAYIIDTDVDGLTAVTNVAAANSQGKSLPIRSKPQTPISRTESSLAEFVRTELFDITRKGGTVGQYRLRRIYSLDGSPICIGWIVTVVSGYPIVGLHLAITNLANEPLLLDQDDADTHDGIQVLSDIGLANQNTATESYRFAIDGDSESTFEDTPRFETHPAPRYVTAFDAEDGVTFGYLGGDTGPRMAVIDRTSVSFLVNEVRLASKESVEYDLFGSIHSGGSESPTVGESLYQTAKNLKWGQITP